MSDSDRKDPIEQRRPPTGERMSVHRFDPTPQQDSDNRTAELTRWRDPTEEGVPRVQATLTAMRSGAPAPRDMRGIRLIGEDLRDLDFTGCDLTRAELSNADMTGARLLGAKLLLLDLDPFPFCHSGANPS